MALTQIKSEGIKDSEVKNADMADDAIGIAELSATGTASSSTYLRGDNSWATVSSVGGATGTDYNDDVKVRWGTGNDLEIYHDGSHSRIKDVGTGYLILNTDTGVLIKNGADDEGIAYFTPDGAAELMYDNSKKFETLSSGVTVTGYLNMADDSTSTGGDIYIPDVGILNIGTSNDLKLYHDGSDSYIVHNGTGNFYVQTSEAGVEDLYLQAGNDVYIRVQTGETALKAIGDGGVELYYDNSKKFETHTSGVTVTGDIVSDNDQSWQGSGNNAGAMFWDKSGDVLKFVDNTSIKWGTDADFQIYHSGADAYLKNSTGNIVIEAKAGESSIKAIPDGSVELYCNNVKTFRTHDNGITLYGPEGGDGHLIMYADEGDDNADFWRLTAGADGDWVLYNYADGAYEKSISATGGGNVELYFNHSKKLETTNSSVKITGHCEPHTDDGGVNIGQSGNRWTNIFASNGTINTSDRNEKNTIQDCDLGLSFIEKLKPVSYKWNNEKAGTKTNYGLIAQDLLEVITEEGKSLDDFGPIHKDEDSAYGLNYTQLIAPLIKAVQELSTEVNTLKTEIAALKAT